MSPPGATGRGETQRSSLQFCSVHNLNLCFKCMSLFQPWKLLTESCMFLLYQLQHFLGHDYMLLPQFLEVSFDGITVQFLGQFLHKPKNSSYGTHTVNKCRRIPTNRSLKQILPRGNSSVLHWNISNLMSINQFRCSVRLCQIFCMQTYSPGPRTRNLNTHRLLI